MKKSFPLLFTLVAASYSASVYSYDDAYHVLSSRIDIIQGAEIYGNGQMQSIVRVRYELDKDVTMESITLKEFGTGAELASIGWESSVTDKGFDHNIGRVTRHNHTQAALKSNEEHKNIYVSTEKKNSNLNVCYEIKTTKKNVENTYSTCLDDDMYNGSVNIFSRRPVHYSGAEFYFSKEQTFIIHSEAYFTYYYTLKKTRNLPDGMSFKLKATNEAIGSSNTIYLHAENHAAARKYDPLYTKFNSVYVYIWMPSKQNDLNITYPNYKNATTVIRRIESYDENYSPLHVIVSELISSTAYYKKSMCYQKEAGYMTDYTCLDQTTKQWLPLIAWWLLQDSVKEKVSKQILIDNYGTEHQINIILDDNGKPMIT